MARIDVSKSGFLAQRDLPPVQPPVQRVPQEVVAPKEEIDSTHSSLEAEIDHFRFNEEGEVPTRPVELSDSDLDLDRFSAAHSPRLIVARIDTSQEIEEEGMDLKPRSGLRALCPTGIKGNPPKMPLRCKLLPASLLHLLLSLTPDYRPIQT